MEMEGSLVAGGSNAETSCSDVQNHPGAYLKPTPPYKLESGAEIPLKISNVFLLINISVEFCLSLELIPTASGPEQTTIS